MKRKVMAIVLATAMAAGLTGCGAASAPTEVKTETETEAATQTAAAGENTLTVWCWDPAFNIYAMEQAGEIYQESHPEFTLNVIETPATDAQTKLTTAATSGDLSTLPDIILINDSAFQKNVISYPDVFVDLTDSGIDFTKFGPAKVTNSVVNGKNYGVPFDNGAVVNAIRTDVIQEAGYTIDDFTDITWDNYITLGKDVLAKTGKPMLSMQAGESDLVSMILQSAGGSMFDAEGNPTIVNNELLVKAMDVYAELVKSGVLVEVNDWDQYVGGLTSGNVASVINGCWILASVQTAEDQAGNWAVTDMPKLDGVEGATNYSNNGGSSWGITTNCKDTALAFDFMASTFAGSVQLYETILPKSGALATYLPAADSEVYGEGQEFFGGQPIYATITEFAGKVPSINTGVYYYEARDAVSTALSNVIAGADINAELKNAQDTVSFQMGK
ncbi:MAG: extracellular solute-binding protein [Lachnospiraceae bacterium]|nr:extracellular solute-binding protein [Lachnospiraceae bacterium]